MRYCSEDSQYRYFVTDAGFREVGFELVYDVALKKYIRIWVTDVENCHIFRCNKQIPDELNHARIEYCVGGGRLIGDIDDAEWIRDFTALAMLSSKYLSYLQNWLLGTSNYYPPVGG